MDTQTQEKQLWLAAESHKEILALYLFGSVLTKEHPGDIDLAILVDEEHAGKNINPFQYLGSLTSEFSNALKGYGVDIVLLNTASPVLCMQVLRKGKIVFERDRRRVVVFITSVIGRYHDLKMIRKPIERQILSGRIYG